VRGETLDVGCRDSPFNSHYNLDVDVWEVPNFVRGIAQKLPFATGSVDTIIMTETLEHLTHPSAALREAKRVARDRVIITVPTTGQTREMTREEVWGNLEETRGHRWARQHRNCRQVCDEDFLRKLGYQWNFFTLKKLRRLIFPVFSIGHLLFELEDEHNTGVGAVCYC